MSVSVFVSVYQCMSGWTRTCTCINVCWIIIEVVDSSKLIKVKINCLALFTLFLTLIRHYVLHVRLYNNAQSQIAVKYR